MDQATVAPTDVSTSLPPLRFIEQTNTCYGKNFHSLGDGFLSQFKDSFFYCNVVQFIIVGLMYFNIGNGKYWKILFFASLTALIGSIIENITVSYICLEEFNTKEFVVYPFLINEIFWATSSYVVPILNLIKMEAFSSGKYRNMIRAIIWILFIPFALIRFNIGYVRMKKGYLFDQTIYNIHNYAFCVSALADVICTISIIYYANKSTKEKAISNTYISDHIQKSSFLTLIVIDIIGFIVSIINICTIKGVFSDYIPISIVFPFHCLVSNFVLILATDALIFKYSANSMANNNTNLSISKYSGNHYKYNFPSTAATNPNYMNYSNDISNNKNDNNRKYLSMY